MDLRIEREGRTFNRRNIIAHLVFDRLIFSSQEIGYIGRNERDFKRWNKDYFILFRSAVISTN